MPRGSGGCGIGTINRGIRDLAESSGIPWIDVHDLFGRDGAIAAGYYHPDGVHPNREGYQVLRETLSRAFDQLEKNSSVSTRSLKGDKS